MFRIAVVLLALLAFPTVSFAEEEINLTISESETTTIKVDSDGEIVTDASNYDPNPESAEHAPQSSTAGSSRKFKPTPGYGYKPSAMREYEQGQAPWGSRPFGGVSGNPSMAASGCGPTSLAMVGATLTGNTKKYDPAKLAYHYRWVYSGRVNWFTPGARDAMSQAGNWMGLKTRRIGRDLGLAADTVKDGGLVIALFGPGKFTARGHYVVLISYKGGLFKMANPNKSKYEGIGFSGSSLLSEGLLQLWSYRRS